MNAIEQFKKERIIKYQNPSGPLNKKKKKIIPKFPKTYPLEKGLSGADPVGVAFVEYMGGRAISGALAAYNRVRALAQAKKTYKLARESNEYTRGASRAWKMKDADTYARNHSGSDNPLGWLYDKFGSPIVNFYDKLNQHPIIGLLIP